MGYAERSYSYRPDGGGGGLGFGGAGGSLLGGLTPWVQRLLVANGAVWLLMWVGLLPGRWAVRTFGFAPADLLFHPWSPVTYMFVHGGFWHLFVNMLVLFFFGPPLERAWGSRYFLRFYLVAGLGGALFSILFLPAPGVSAGTPMVGASAATFGLMLAFALLWPEARIYIWGILPIRAKWFVTILAGFTFFASFGARGDVAHWAHLGGLVTGFAYLRWGERADRQLGALLSRLRALLPDALSSPSDPSGKGRGSRRSRWRSGGGGRAREESPARGRSGRGGEGDAGTADTLDEVDRILDKIREEGMEALTEEERAFLDEMSRRYRG